MKKYEVSHICAAVVATVGIVVIGAIALNGLVSFEPSKMTELISAVVSFLALIISGLALIFLKKTFEAARAQVDLASSALKHSQALADAEMRPRLVVSDDILIYHRRKGNRRSYSANIADIEKGNAQFVVAHLEDVDEWVIEMSVSNIGRTAACNVQQFSDEYYVCPKMINDAFLSNFIEGNRAYANTTRYFGKVIHPGQTITYKSIIPYVKEFPPLIVSCVVNALFYNASSLQGGDDLFVLGFACEIGNDGGEVSVVIAT